MFPGLMSIGNDFNFGKVTSTRTTWDPCRPGSIFCRKSWDQLCYVDHGPVTMGESPRIFPESYSLADRIKARRGILEARAERKFYGGK